MDSEDIFAWNMEATTRHPRALAFTSYLACFCSDMYNEVFRKKRDVFWNIPDCNHAILDSAQCGFRLFP